jgi:hypothetical protein
MTAPHFLSRFAGSFLLPFVFTGICAHADSPKPAFPVGNIDAYPTIVATGSNASLIWSTVAPSMANEPDFYYFIRQILVPDQITAEIQVGSSGQTLPPLPFGPSMSRFELMAVDPATLAVYALDSTFVGPYVPAAQVAIRSEDPYPYLPRTRADKPFQVDVTVAGIIGGDSGPEFSRAVNLVRFTQSYGAGGTGAQLDRSQAVLLSQSAIETNGQQSFSYAVGSFPDGGGNKARGEQRFSVFSNPSLESPSMVIKSKFIQIWPVADGAISGISEGQTIGPDFPDVTFTANDLYPESTTDARVYPGEPRAIASGSKVPRSIFFNDGSVPANWIDSSDQLDAVIDSSGPWTLELVTETPFGTDCLGQVSFTVVGLPSSLENWRLACFGSSENSGDGADINDFDHDGLINLIEFAFGSDPKASSTDHLPAPQRVGDQWVIDFPQPPAVSGISYGAEWSANLLLGSWNPIPDTGVAQQHTFSIPDDSAPSLYFRLKVISPQ